MFGIDPGFSCGSVMLVVKRKPVDWLVIKDDKEREGHERARFLARRYVDIIGRFSGKHEPSNNVAIEQPLFSWGRKNPKAFAASLGLYYRIIDLLHKEGYKVIEVNASTVKLTAGHGKMDKEGMVKAYIQKTGIAPGSTNRKGQETLADAYFIALSGLVK